MAACLILAVAGLAGALQAEETHRIAYFHTELSRKGPGLLLRDLHRGEDRQIAAVLEILRGTEPDILLLGGIDHDARGEALSALQIALAKGGWPMPHGLTVTPNSGVPSGLDLDGDGRLGEQEDAFGFGRFRGAGGLVLLSRAPLGLSETLCFTRTRWGALAWADPPPGTPPEARLSSVAHCRLSVAVTETLSLDVLTVHASPPVFDGPEDRNGRRNNDELLFWSRYLDDTPPSRQSLPVVMGTFNADPKDGEARRGGLMALLRHDLLQDPQPTSRGGREAGSEATGQVRHRGDPALDTVDWPEDRPDAPGNLRVDYILPSRALRVEDAGVHWPDSRAPQARATAEAASRHRLIWVDVALPGRRDLDPLPTARYAEPTAALEHGNDPPLPSHPSR